MDNNFQPIFDYIDEANSKIEKRLARIEENDQDVKTGIANLSAQIKQYHEEMMVNGHRIDRLEQLVKVIGDKVGVPVVY